MRGMNLAGANFTCADVSWADFRGANLTGANFTQAWMLAPKMKGANVTGAIFTGATFGWSGDRPGPRPGCTAPLVDITPAGLLS